MTIPPTAASGAVAPVQGLQSPSAPSTSPGGISFGGALEGVSESLNEADMLSQQVATGEISDLSQLTAAAAKAQLAMDLTVAFRDRAVQSFQQIMQMQI